MTLKHKYRLVHYYDTRSVQRKHFRISNVFGLNFANPYHHYCDYCVIIFIYIDSWMNRLYIVVYTLFSFCTLVVVILKLMITPPAQYPYLFDLFISVLSFIQFFLTFIMTNVLQWSFRMDDENSNSDSQNMFVQKIKTL